MKTGEQTATASPPAAPTTPKGSSRRDVAWAVIQLVLLLGLPAVVYFGLKSQRPFMYWAAVGAGVVYVALRIFLGRQQRREERGAPALQTDAADASGGQTTMGCVGLLLFPLALIVGAVALRYDLAWLTWTAVAMLVAAIVLKARIEFRIPERTAEGIVGGRPRDAVPVPAPVAEHVARSGFLTEGEALLAGVDDSWIDNGTSGTLLTDRRIISYRASAIRFDFALAEVDQVFIRRMWYPGAGFLGRGEFFGEGPVVVLRMRFRMKDGASRRKRFSVYANPIHSFVAELLNRLGDRVVVQRTLPGM